MVIVGNRELSLEDFETVVFDKCAIELDAKALEAVKGNFEFLKQFSQDKIIYGINTGFGPMAQYRIDDQELNNLQYNLIRAHCSGSGEPISHDFVRAVLLARLNTLMLAKSGVHDSVVRLLADLLNHDICPVIFQHGGVGASGDLVQLAHLGLCLIGEGDVTHEGETFPAHVLFKKFNLQPISIKLREGLAIMNGTSAMGGIGMINLIQARKLVHWSLMASCMINEIVESYDDHFSAPLNEAKLHYGQRSIAKQMTDVLEDSRLIKNRADHLYQKTTTKVFKAKVQEYYSIRCVPQILGPIYDTIRYAEMVVANEINSVNDNPVIDDVLEDVYHGGNFHGDYVSLEMDKLRICLTKLAMLADRQLNFLLNDKLNEKLPPFINLGTLGLNFGMQGVQFTATSTVAECQTLATSMYVHSIPNNNDNQDIVSMGTNAALLTSKVIENAFEVLAIELLGILQAVDYLNIQPNMSQQTASLYHTLRAIAPKFVEDTVRYPVIRELKKYLRNTAIAVEKVL
ncbi:MAG: aromatic amino acid ammonia-lyase [Bacteroidota bacterium]